ncbi:hypothetical protein Ahia01_001088300 [Argonauta hians]
MALVTIQRSPSPSNSPESEDDLDACSSRQRSFSENYFTVKGAALILPQSECAQRSPQSNGGDIQLHLQQMIYLLRPEDTIKVAVKLESAYELQCASRYMVVVCCMGRLDTEESIMLGIDMKDKDASIGLVLPIWANSKITLDGDGGFGVNTEGADYLFKPVSVQAMWSALQSLHKVINTANVHNYIPKGLTHTWVGYYTARISSDLSCIKEWNIMEDIESFAADSPYSTEKPELDPDGMKTKISVKLKEVMMCRDLEETTCKELRNMLEESFNRSLKEYKSFIDEETIRILRQMDAPTEIYPYLYLGSEWNASNYEELEENGVTGILNISREIDNFFPEKFEYLNVREFDNEFTDLMKHWKRTHEFIRKTKEANGKVLVHCKMGISRSASTVIAYKMKEDCCTYQEAYDFVKEKRGVIKPNKAFVAQLKEYHGILTASQKRHMFNTKSKSEEADTRNGATCSVYDNEFDFMQRHYDNPDDAFSYGHGFYRDDCFLPVRSPQQPDSDGFATEQSLNDAGESGLLRYRANTYDCANFQSLRYKADNSWISSQPFPIGESSTDPDGVDDGGGSGGVGGGGVDVSKGLDLAHLTSTQAAILRQIPPYTRTRAGGACHLSPAGNVGSPPPSPRVSIGAGNNSSSGKCPTVVGVDSEKQQQQLQQSSTAAVAASSVAACAVTSSPAKMAEGADQSSEVPEPYVKEAIPWNPGKVRQQWRKMEERIKSGISGGNMEADGDGGDDDGGGGVGGEVTTTTSMVGAESSSSSGIGGGGNTAHSLSVSAPSVPHHPWSGSVSSCEESSLSGVSEVSASPTLGGGGGASQSATQSSTTTEQEARSRPHRFHHHRRGAERPHSVCEDGLGKRELFASLAPLRGRLTADSTDDGDGGGGALPEVYKMEEIDFPVGIVRRTTQELEKRHRSSCHDLTTLGLLPPSETKIQPVQRSSSLGSERDRPRLERTKWRETCTPILSPRNMVQTPAMELDLGVAIEGGSVRLKAINFETLNREDDDLLLLCQDRLVVVPQRGEHSADDWDATNVQHGVTDVTGMGQGEGTSPNITTTTANTSHSITVTTTAMVTNITATTTTTATTTKDSPSPSLMTSVAHLRCHPKIEGGELVGRKGEEEGKACYGRQHRVFSKGSLGHRESLENSKRPGSTEDRGGGPTPASPHPLSSTGVAAAAPSSSSSPAPSLFTASLSKFNKETTERHREEHPGKPSVTAVPNTTTFSTTCPSFSSSLVRKTSLPSSGSDPPTLHRTQSVKGQVSEQHQQQQQQKQQQQHAGVHVPSSVREIAQFCETKCFSASDINATTTTAPTSTTTIPERTADFEKSQFCKTQSLDESTLHEATGVEGSSTTTATTNSKAGGGGSHKIVRHLIGKFDSSLHGDSAGLSTSLPQQLHRATADADNKPGATIIMHTEPTAAASVVTSSQSAVIAERVNQFSQSAASVGEAATSTNTTTTQQQQQPVTHTTPSPAVLSGPRSQFLLSSSSTTSFNTNLAAATFKPVEGGSGGVGGTPKKGGGSASMPQSKSSSPLPPPHHHQAAPSTPHLPVQDTTSTAATTTATSTSASTSHTASSCTFATTTNTTTTTATSSTSSSPSASWKVSPPSSLSPSALQEGRKVRKLQGKTHPLSKLESRQFSQNPSFYSTM